MKYAVNKKDPAELGSPRLDNMDEQSVCNSIPISKFKSNHLSKKKQAEEEEKLLQDAQLSPTASYAYRDVNFKNIDHPSMLSQVTGGV